MCLILDSFLSLQHPIFAHPDISLVEHQLIYITFFLVPILFIDKAREPKIKVWKILKMKQKIVLEVHMTSDKCRKKARKIAALTEGLMSMSIDTDKNQLTVEGVGIDAAILTTTLRKRVGRTNIKSVEEVKPKDDKGSTKKTKCSYTDAPPLCPGYEVRYKIGCFPNT